MPTAQPIHPTAPSGEPPEPPPGSEPARPGVSEQATPGRVSIVIVAYRSSPVIGRCVASLMSLPERPEVIVIDNAVNDAELRRELAAFPEVRIVASPTNLGFAGGCNLGFANATGEVIAVVGPDTMVEPGWLEQITRPLADPGIGLTAATIRFLSRPDRISSCGLNFNVFGLGTCRLLEAEALTAPPSSPVASVHGCSFATRREVIERIGGFDESYFMYVEEVDLSLRAYLAGYRTWHAREAIAYHDYELDLLPWRFYYFERNRQLMLRQMLSRPAVVILSPILLLGELFSFGYALTQGRAHVAAKLRGWWWLLTNGRQIRAKRRANRALRPDRRSVLDVMSPTAEIGRLAFGPGLSRILETGLRLLSALPLRLARWVDRRL